MLHALLATCEVKDLRELLRDCRGRRSETERDKRQTKLFHILLYSHFRTTWCRPSSTLTMSWSIFFRKALAIVNDSSPWILDSITISHIALSATWWSRCSINFPVWNHLVVLCNDHGSGRQTGFFREGTQHSGIEKLVGVECHSEMIGCRGV